MESWQPDQIVVDTIHEHVQGRATVEDVRAAMQLALDAPGWDKISKMRRYYLAHVAGCDQCLLGLLDELRASHAVRDHDELLSGQRDTPFIFETAKGVH